MGAPNLSQPRLKLGSQLFKVVEESIATTFREMFNVEVTMTSCEYATGPEANREVSGIIGFVQDSLEGVLSLGFPRSTLFNALSTLYGTKLTQLDEMSVDGVGELTNTVFGLSKAAFSKEGFKFQMCLPMVVIGEGYFIYSYNPIELIRMRFQSPYGEFWAEIFICY